MKFLVCRVYFHLPHFAKSALNSFLFKVFDIGYDDVFIEVLMLDTVLNFLKHRHLYVPLCCKKAVKILSLPVNHCPDGAIVTVFSWALLFMVILTQPVIGPLNAVLDLFLHPPLSERKIGVTYSFVHEFSDVFDAWGVLKLVEEN